MKSATTLPEATELEWLQWFFRNADFGPADGDVRMYLRQQFEQSTKKAVPVGYRDEE